MDWKWGKCPYSTKTWELLRNPSPPPSRFPSTLEISLGLRPQEISRVWGNLLGVRDGFPNNSLVLVEHGYNISCFRHGTLTYFTVHDGHIKSSAIHNKSCWRLKRQKPFPGWSSQTSVLQEAFLASQDALSLEVMGVTESLTHSLSGR